MKDGRAISGLQYAVKRSGKAVAYCALSIKCGTRDEARYEDGKLVRQDYNSGIAHFVEHTIFKGTSKKSAAVINGYLDKLGGELNAYTTKEEIVLHATVLKEDLPKAASLLFELVTSPIFPASEVELERGVIIDEINSYKDSPAEEVYDKFEEMLFKGHPLCGPILGTVKSVKKITPEELRRFVWQKFVPEKMAFTVVAVLPEVKMQQMVVELSGMFFEEAEGADGPAGVSAGGSSSEDLSGSPSGDGPAASTAMVSRSETPSGAPSLQFPSFHEVIHRNNHQANIVIGAVAPSLYSGRERVAAVLLANILGGPASNSILNSVLREKNGLVYSVECTYTQYADTGIMAIYLGCDRENIERCFDKVYIELMKLRRLPLTEPKLKAAKKQLLGQLAISGDNGENQCLSMGKSLLAYSHVLSDQESIDLIKSITAEEIQSAASSIFSMGHISHLLIV